MCAIASSNARMCRSRARNTPSPPGCHPATDSSHCRNSSIPSPSNAETWCTAPCAFSALANVSRETTGGPKRSILLTTDATGNVGGSRFSISASLTPAISPASVISNAAPALLIAAQVRSMPILSTASSVTRKPAVSIRWIGTPSRCMVARTWSRVVPGIGVTIAMSSPASLLSRLDFPTFGRPISTTVSPSRSTAPSLALRAKSACKARICWSFNFWAARSAGSISSSGKSMHASTCIRKSVRSLVSS